MIIEYYRPNTMEEALKLLARKDIQTRPIGGGTALSRNQEYPVAVVDLQDLDINQIKDRGTILELGATVTLQNMLEATNIFPELEEIIRHEATYNLRQVASIAGTLVAASGRSPFATALLAMDTQLIIKPDEKIIGLGDFLPLRSDWLKGQLIVAIRIPNNVALKYEYVARSPADQPIVCVAVCKWPSGRIRVALGGFGDAPMFVFDGTESGGAELAAKNAYSLAEDEWAGAEYRQEVASILTSRALSRLAKE
jgi:CO/xanthine dehydrogenase FAD-binding subunit